MAMSPTLAMHSLVASMTLTGANVPLAKALLAAIPAEALLVLRFALAAGLAQAVAAAHPGAIQHINEPGSKRMRRHRQTILVTGFGPFPGAPKNASSMLAEAVAAQAESRLPGFAVHAETLPTQWRAGPERLAALLDALRPALTVHFGVSRRARGFVVETRARNVTQHVYDACGETPLAVCIDDDGPTEMAVTLPTGLIVERLRKLGLPVQLSRDAGGYLCNAVLYHSLEHARRHESGGLGPRRGFIHIPDRLAGGGPRGPTRRAAASRLEWEGAVKGGLEILAACAGIGER